MAFTHLHVHTGYSLLDGSSKIRELVNYAKELGMNSLAITDHGVMYGVIEFYKVAKEAGIKPIIGCEVYVAPGSRFDREKVSGEERYYHLIILAKNNIGYNNLIKIVSRGFTDGFYYKPRVDFEVLEKFSEGLVVLSACLGGEIPTLIMKGKYEEAKETALKYERTFGKGNYFLELQDHGIFEQAHVNKELIRMSRETGIELVATNDVHYIHSEDWEAHDILLCIQTAKKVHDENRMKYMEGEFYLRSEEEMRELFSYIPEAIDNTQKVADMCNVDFEFGVTKLPEYEVPKDYTAREYLKKLCEEGIYKRYKEVTKELEERLHYELEVINNMGYVDYFLIVWDFINYAKSNDIPVGPGRGSAAGSIVSYCLGITDVDPIKYQLLFERFLNPERVSMPDIDIDFCGERRQEVIDYVVQKYGKDRVCQIITFGTMAAKGVIRDVGRAMDISYAKCDMAAKSVPNKLDITLEKALQNREFRANYDADDEIKNLVDMAIKLEGLPRHSSVHAAGVVISKKALDEYVPLSKASDGSITTQFTMTTLEELGLLKMDFLGLRTLTIIKNAVVQIKKNYGLDIDILNIDFADKKVYDLISTGKTEGIFQIESSGMKSFMKELKPDCIEDIIAGISLYRPGPMDFIPKYIKGKNEKGNISYDCEQLKPILSPTYGCIVYQEQVMQIVRDLAGYTLGRSDLVRRAMSKKKASIMEKERKNFVYGNISEGIKGCIENGISENIANKIFDEMSDFAKYAFNKSHAACYAVVAYQTAWLKCYYPKEYMAALLTAVMYNTSKVNEYILECKQMGIAILPPDVNEGESGFSVSKNGIRFGLSAIKGLGNTVTDEVVKNRTALGKFKNLEDFVERMSSKEVNRRTLESFIKAGAFDSFSGNRHQKLKGMEVLLENKSKTSKNKIAGQMNLFEIMTPKAKEIYQIKLPNVEEFSKSELLSFEKEVIGMYISGHPLDEYAEEILKNITAKTIDFFARDEEEPVVIDKSNVTIGGIVSSISIKTTRNNDTMAFVNLEDLYGNVEVVVFPKIYEKYKKLLNENEKVYIMGKVQLGDDGNGKILANSVKAFDRKVNELWLQYQSLEDFEEDKIKLLEFLSLNKGDDKAIIFIRESRLKKVLDKGINVNQDIISYLSRKMGEDNVKVVTKILKS